MEGMLYNPKQWGYRMESTRPCYVDILKVQIRVSILATKQCSVGTKCQFAHGQSELRSINDPLPPSAMSAISQAIQQPPPQHNYKSIQCKYFLMGFCKNGTNCTFIHEDLDPSMQQQQMQPQQYYGQQQQPQHNQNNQQQQYYGGGGNQYANQNYQYQQQNHNIGPQQHLDQQVLLMILSELESVFSYREDLQIALRDAISQVKNGNNGYGSSTIKGIVHNSDLSNDEKVKYQQIYDKAKVYSAQLQHKQQAQQ